jgi:FKBP-type peptidyl-prolyl cis-trans isomerase SlyD
MTKPQNGDLIRLSFTLENEDEVFDGAPEEKPLELKIGSGKLSAPIEKLLTSVDIGEEFDFTLDENLAFGERKNDLAFDVARSKLPEKLRNITVGMYFDTLGPDKMLHRFRVIKETPVRVSIDGNHPLAGQALRFHGKILSKVGI